MDDAEGRGKGCDAEGHGEDHGELEARGADHGTEREPERHGVSGLWAILGCRSAAAGLSEPSPEQQAGNRPSDRPDDQVYGHDLLVHNAAGDARLRRPEMRARSDGKGDSSVEMAW